MYYIKTYNSDKARVEYLVPDGKNGFRWSTEGVGYSTLEEAGRVATTILKDWRVNARSIPKIEWAAN